MVVGSQELGQEDHSVHLCEYSPTRYITVTSSVSNSSTTNWEQQSWWRDHKNWARETTTVPQPFGTLDCSATEMNLKKRSEI